MHVTPCMENTEETIEKYAVDSHLFRLGSTNPKKKNQPLDFGEPLWKKTPEEKKIFCRPFFCLNFFFNI